MRRHDGGGIDAGAGRSPGVVLPQACGAIAGTLDARGRFLSIDGPVEAALGRLREELIGVCAVRIVAPSLRRRVMSFWEALRSLGTIDGARIHLVRPDGGSASLDLTLTLLPARRTRDAAVRFVGRPSTVEAELDFWRVEAARRRLAARLAADAAHEINNPLQAVLAHAAVLRGGSDPRGEMARTDSAKRLREAAHRVRETACLVQHLRRRFEGAAGPMLLDHLVTDGLALFAVAARRRGVRFETHLAAAGAAVTGSPSTLVDLVLGLLDMAIRLARRASVIDVATTTCGAVGRQRLEVSCTHGALDEALDLAVTLRSEGGRLPASGFAREALVVALRLSRRCRGTLEITSRAGRGTRIILELPAAATATADGPRLAPGAA